MAVMTSRQAAELDHALERGGWDSAYVKEACAGDFLSQALGFLRGDYELVKIDRVVDCDADPFVPEGHKVVKHVKGGKVHWEKFCFGIIYGYDFNRNERGLDKEALVPQFLVGKRVPNANLLRYLLEFPHLIPKEWNGIIPFWGTIFENEGGICYVSCLRAEGLRPGQYNLRVDEYVNYDHNHPILL